MTKALAHGLVEVPLKVGRVEPEPVHQRYLLSNLDISCAFELLLAVCVCLLLDWAGNWPFFFLEEVTSEVCAY